MTDNTLTRQQVIDGLRVHAGRVSEDGFHTRAIYMNAAADMLEAAPPAAGNNQLKRTMEFDLTDAPMLMAAVQTAVCVAFMNGKGGAKKRLKQYQEHFQQLIPEAAKRFEEETWAEIGMALRDAETIHITIVPRSWEQEKSWWSDGPMRVSIRNAEGAERKFHSDAGLGSYVKRGDNAIVQQLAETLTELAPMDCIVTWDSAPR